MLSQKEVELNKDCDDMLQVVYDYFKFAGESKASEYTNELMNKMTDAVKATIRFNNKLTKAINDKTFVLDPQACSMLNTFYSFYEQMPKTEEEVSAAGGRALMEVYTSMLQNMTPIAIMISTELSAKQQ